MHTQPEPGVCIWLTGVSGSGKSTLTQALVPRLETHGRTVSVLDVVPLLAKQRGERTSEGKLLRKAFVAGEIARHGGIAVCVTVSAMREVRERTRAIVGPERFLEVLVEVPAEVAAARREARQRRPTVRRRIRLLRRRLRSRLRRGPTTAYQRPLRPDVVIDTQDRSPEEGAQAIIDVLVRRGFLRPEGAAPVASVYSDAAEA